MVTLDHRAESGRLARSHGCTEQQTPRRRCDRNRRLSFLAAAIALAVVGVGPTATATAQGKRTGDLRDTLNASGPGMPVSGPAPHGGAMQTPGSGLFIAAPAAGREDEAAVAALNRLGQRRVTRSRRVQVDLDQLRSFAAERGGRIRLNLFDDADFTAVLDRVDGTSRGFVWVGRIPDVEMSAVTLATEGGVVYGSILLPSATFELRYTADGTYDLAELDSAAFLPEAPPSEPGSEGASGDGPGGPGVLGEPEVPQADDGSIVDVMVFYTPAAAAAAGGTS